MVRVYLPISVAMGLLIAWVDARPNWDDAGITAGLLVLSSGLLGLLAPRRAWIWALGIGIWIPLHAIVTTHNFTALVALAFPFVGAYAGMGVRRLTGPQQP